MGAGSDRNKPCPCGSGRKWKRCHLIRGQQDPVPFQEIIDGQKKAFGKRYCLLAETGTCEGGVISAHTVPHARLRLIARDGHVYAVATALGEIRRSSGNIRFALKGISLCTTFAGFCRDHDNNLFAPVEDQPFVGNAEQCFLLYLRSLARELYEKRAHATSTDQLKELDRGRSAAHQIHLQTFASSVTAGIALALADLEHWWAFAMGSMTGKSFDEYESALFYLDQVPAVACCGGIFPEFDFSGNAVQHLGEKGLDFISVTMLPLDPSRDGGERGVAAFVWHKQSSHSRALIEDLMRVPGDRQADSILRFVFEHVENTAVRPDWWQRQQLAIEVTGTTLICARGCEVRRFFP